MLERLGHIPQVGETVDIGPYRLTVTAVDGRRIDRVTLTTRPSDEPSADGADVEAERPDGDERR